MSWVENNLVNPVNKWFKHITSVIAGRTYRGKKKTLKRYIQKVIQSVDSAKNDMVNRMKNSDAAISGLQQQIAELKSVVANQMTVQQNSSDAKISGVQQQIAELKSIILANADGVANKLDNTAENINSHLSNLFNGLSSQQKNDFNNIHNLLVNLYALKNSDDKDKLEFRTFGNLATCIRQNLHKIPNDIDLIVGIPRSGIIPAYIIALFMNKKCCSLDEFIAGINSSNGFRNITNTPVHNVLVVDDSMFSGKEMARVREKLATFTEYNFTFMTVYARTPTAHLADVWLELVDGRRVWQWNYLNHTIAGVACFDMDGVLCVDPTKEQNDDGEKYKQFIQNAKPLYIPKYKIRAIVTSRLEKYRALTEKWLADNGVIYDELIMLDLPTAEERRRLGCHADFKADIYKRMTDTTLFVESEPKQAQEIAAKTGKQVLCVANDELY